MNLYLSKLLEKKDLTVKEISILFENMFHEHYNDSQISALLMAFQMKGITKDELLHIFKVFRKKLAKHHIETNDSLVDIMSTGGSTVKAFNVSTLAMLIAAGAGVYVSKHTNRSIRSHLGSSDLLEILGVNLHLSFIHSKEMLKKLGFCFCYFSHLHALCHQLSFIRRSLKVPTFLDVLIPMLSPLGAKRLVIGVSQEKYLSMISYIFQKMGGYSVLLVHGLDGMDEITVTAPTKIVEIRDQTCSSYFLDPREFAMEFVKQETIVSRDTEENRDIVYEILSGKKGAKSNLAILNAAALIYISDRAPSWQEAIQRAQMSLVSKSAEKKIKELMEFKKENHKL